ncbi:hypothetical protein HPB47_026741, partial [Ixodes persulcatus]
FHLQQAKLRSKIRIEDGRAKPIDLLARYISAEEEDFGVEMLEPYIYLNGLTVQDLEDLQEDIKVYMELENSRNLNYWRDVQIIVEEELRKLRRLDTSSASLIIRTGAYRGTEVRPFVFDQVHRCTPYILGDGAHPPVDHQIVERREGINAAVSTEVVDVFKGKTPGQLQALYAQIQKRIHSKEEGLDVREYLPCLFAYLLILLLPYWETLLSRLKAYMARARLRERHQENLRRKLFQLKQEQGVDSGPLFPCVKKESPSRPDGEGSPQPGPSGSQPGEASEVKEEPSERPASSAASTAEGEEEEEESKEGEAEEPAVVNDPIAKSEEDYRSGGYSPVLVRNEDLEPGTILIDTVDDEQRLEFARQQLMGTGSRVQGFEWNKYNQTHYDMDNPPPKIVQGYKFNIFYPDLIDKNRTPEYFLTPIDGNKDFSILRFHAGPPYEDIAFKIVNREWEYSYKRGFRCQFHNNIFQLWFHFKRYRYRR